MYDGNLFNVDTTGVQEMSDFEIYPAGKYPALMTGAQRKANKAQTGSFLECNYSFSNCELQGKRYISRLNLWNPNPQAVEIAMRELKSLRLALGLPDTEGRTEMYINKPLILNIGVKPQKDDPKKMENYLLGIEPINGGGGQQSYGQQPQQYQPQPQPNYGNQPVQQQPQQNQQQPQQGYVQPQQQGAPVQPQPQQAPAAYQPNPNQPPPWKRG